MKNREMQSGTDPPVKKTYIPPIIEFVPVGEDWVLLGGALYSTEKLERDNPFTP